MIPRTPDAPGAGGGPARARRARGRPAAEARAVGRQRPDHPARDRASASPRRSGREVAHVVAGRRRTSCRRTRAPLHRAADRGVARDDASLATPPTPASRCASSTPATACRASARSSRSCSSSCALRRGQRVLEVGCGAGDDVRTIARRVGTERPRARDRRLAARRRRGGAALAAAATCRSSSASATRSRSTCPTRSVDRCRAERLLMHVDGEPAVRSSRRSRACCAPGGRLVVFDFDWDALVIDGAEPELTRRIVRSYSDGVAQRLRRAHAAAAAARRRASST